jgi:uncharacterized membrane protein YjgN (DUF898 family)
MSEQVTAAAKTLPFEFTGKAGEYFKIWIVNILLTILTLGVYSAWAKVRNKRYFYGNTRLDGSSFEYTADPIGILKGRLIAFAVVAVFVTTVSFFPVAEPLFWLAFVVALPWLVVRSLAFNARNSVFKNISFDFTGNYGEAIAVFIGLPLLNVVTLGLAYPYFVYRKQQFLVANSGFGLSRFHYDTQAKSFYGVYLKASAMLLVGIIAFLALGGNTILPVAHAAEGAAPVGPERLALTTLPMLLIVPIYMFIGAYILTSVTNLLMNGAYIKQQRLQSSLHPGGMFWIYLSNLGAIIISLGLLIPWAKIRTAHYRFENLSLQTDGELNAFVAGMQRQVKATGEELADAFDVDLGI